MHQMQINGKAGSVKYILRRHISMEPIYPT